MFNKFGIQKEATRIIYHEPAMGDNQRFRFVDRKARLAFRMNFSDAEWSIFYHKINIQMAVWLDRG
jgi:hypothetical protein